MSASARSAPAQVDFDRIQAALDAVFDPRSGTIRNAADTRQIYLSTDVIRGVLSALRHEAGDAWGIVLSNCGRSWGKRIVRTLSRELRFHAQIEPGQLPVPQFVTWIEAYFRQHGWGTLKVWLDDAPAHGIVRVTLAHSLFAEVLDEEEDRVDFLISGLLQSMFEAVSGRELRCVEVASERRGDPEGVFFISAPHRIEAVEPMAEARAPVEEILTQLKRD